MHQQEPQLFPKLWGRRRFSNIALTLGSCKVRLRALFLFSHSLAVALGSVKALGLLGPSVILGS